MVLEKTAVGKGAYSRFFCLPCITDKETLS
jgi:hypothetical protein